MKKSFRTLFLAASLCAAIVTTQAAADPGAIDFGQFTPTDEGGFVEVNISGNLIRMASRLAEKSEPEVAKLLNGLRSVRVNVIGVNDENREELLKRIEAVRTQLDSNDWERVVTVKEGTEDIGVYVKLRGEEAVEGVVVTVIDSNNEAVFVNVVGDIRPEQIAELGEHFNIEPLKHLNVK